VDPYVLQVVAAIAHYINIPFWRGYKPWEILAGIVLTESSGNPNARRFEPGEAVKYGVQLDRGQHEPFASWGLMQVMGTNINVQLGLAPDCTMLNFKKFGGRELLGLAFGARELVEAMAMHKDDFEAALGQYNGGAWGAQREPGNMMVNDWEYVERVAHNAELASGQSHE